MLTCEHMDDPTVVDITEPRLSWINNPIKAHIRGQKQSAYRVVVSSSKKDLSAGKYDIWDSGKVESSDSYLIPYNGKILQSAKDYWWKVMVWDKDGNQSNWSRTAMWGMGLLSQSEWKAKWIGAPWQGENARQTKGQRPPEGGYEYHPAPMFRKSFKANKAISSAKVFVTGLGYFELYINSKKVGDDCLVPNFTDFTVRHDLDKAGLAIKNDFRNYKVMYLAYDVTSMIRNGKNALGAIVGDGFYDCVSHWVSAYGSPRMLCQLEVTYGDGTKDVIASDETWKVKPSPIVMNGVYEGELYDSNLETPNWSSANCDEAAWQQAVIRQAPTGDLVAHTAPTDKVVEILQPQSFTKNTDGSYEVDFGTEIAGWIRLKNIKGNKGDTLDVKYICESPLGIQRYVFNGKSNQSYAPRFTWYVFRKAIISGTKDLKPEMLVAEVVNTDVKITSEFETSNPLFNQINTIWQRSQLDNMHGGVASDCPHRERSPYTGDGQVACAIVMHNFDAAAFYQKWIGDMRDAQSISSGYVPNGAPWQPGCGGGVAWGAAMNIMPWEFYLQYADTKMLEQNYEAMKAQLDYMLSWRTADGTMLHQKCNIGSDRPNYWFNLGDWAPAYKVPSEELVHTFYMWRCADFTAKAAKALNQKEDYKKFTDIADNIKKAFHKKFYDPIYKTYGNYGCNIFALVMNVPEEYRNDVVNTLRDEISVKFNKHLNTGIFATQFLFETLAANGMNDLAYEVMNQKTFPSFGHWIEQGATTTWEQWDGRDSRNHPMFGGGLTWFYRTLAGVNFDEAAPGYKHIIIKPNLPNQLSHVSYSNKTPYGKMKSEVIKVNGETTMNITVPVGTYATVYIPSAHNSINENGKSIKDIKEIKQTGFDGVYSILEVPQGSYNFVGR